MTARMRSQTDSDGPGKKPEISMEGARRAQWRRRRWIAIGASLGLLVAGLGVGAGWYFSRPGPPCASCLSIKPVNAAMRSVMQAIDRENAVVLDDAARPWVSVALLNPFTLGLNSDETAQRMVDQLRGAYLGQLEMNDPAATIGVRLILINEGTSAEQDEGKAVLQLESMEKSDRIVAVAGMGLSNAATAAAATALSRDGMPMFTAVATADQFTSQVYSGLVQVTPDVTAQINLLAATLKHLGTAILVYDETTTDYYTADMRKAFEDDFGSHLVGVQHPYAPGLPDTSEDFRLIAQQVCYQQGPSPVILYAGRQIVLSQFIQQLQGVTNSCTGKQIYIITAGDADGLDPRSTAASPSEGHVSVVYTDIIDLSKLSSTFEKLYNSKLIALADPHSTGLTDPWMSTSYNTMMAASTAINAGYGATSPNPPGKADVRYWVDQLNNSFKSSRTNSPLTPIGATGTFSLDNNGKLLNPDIPIYEDTAGKRVPLSQATASGLSLP
jgi:ABC-type branched-subunit amino acid transport system substrate-binding protein